MLIKDDYITFFYKIMSTLSHIIALVLYLYL
jgi:hypothetical protein